MPDVAVTGAGLVAGCVDSDPAVWSRDGHRCLFGCTCGDVGCWPLTAKLAVTGNRVRWSTFRTGHRQWHLRRLGPFTFDRARYEAALQRSATINAKGKRDELFSYAARHPPVCRACQDHLSAPGGGSNPARPDQAGPGDRRDRG